jgi:hypothetical protein
MCARPIFEYRQLSQLSQQRPPDRDPEPDPDPEDPVEPEEPWPRSFSVSRMTCPSGIPAFHA